MPIAVGNDELGESEPSAVKTAQWDPGPVTSIQLFLLGCKVMLDVRRRNRDYYVSLRKSELRGTLDSAKCRSVIVVYQRIKSGDTNI